MKRPRPVPRRLDTPFDAETCLAWVCPGCSTRVPGTSRVCQNCGFENKPVGPIQVSIG